MYIRSSSCISLQNSFSNPGYSAGLQAIEHGAECMHPDYSLYISAMDRRRMSSVLKMSVSTALDALKKVADKEAEAIIVGTSMGTCVNTKTFMDVILHSDGGLLSPTSFIHSTHNTIAGQISMAVKNHSYNITHTQNSLSFEHALIDALLCLKEGKDHVLIGAADENTEILYNMKSKLKLSEIGPQGAGAAFFVLGNTSGTNDEVEIQACTAHYGTVDFNKMAEAFLSEFNLKPHDIDLLLYAAVHMETAQDIKSCFGSEKCLDYQQYSGVYYTSPAFALHLACDMLKAEENTYRHLLICNRINPKNTGLTLIRKKV